MGKLFDNPLKKTISIVLALVITITTFIVVGNYTGVEAQDIPGSYDEIVDVFHDQGGEYMTPLEPTANDKVVIRLRVVKDNVTHPKIHYSTDFGHSYKTIDMKYEKVEDNGYYADWKVTLPKLSVQYYYYFSVSNLAEDSTKYYDIYGLKTDKPANYKSCFCVRPGHTTPDWSKGAYWYTINPNAFYNADPLNDVSGKIADMTVGEKMASHYSQMYGGDIKGVEAKLDYIKDLGVSAIALMPLWPSLDAAGMGNFDWNQVAPRNGNEEDLVNLISKAHDEDLRVMLDAVVELSPNDSAYLNYFDIYPLQGAAQAPKGESKFYDMFNFTLWPTSFRRFWSSAAVDFASETTKELVYKGEDAFLTRYLKGPYNADGYRFDAGGLIYSSTDTTHDIITEMKEYFKAANPEAVFLNEVEFGTDLGVWDTSWNWDFTNALRAVANGTGNLADLQKAAIKRSNTPRCEVLSQYIHLSAMDHKRINESYRWYATVLMQMTYLGSPSLWYGEEIKSEYTSSDVVMSGFDWNEANWSHRNYYFMKALGQLRNDYTCLKDGVVKWGEVSDSKNYLEFGRWDKNGAVITALNLMNDNSDFTINVRQYGIKDGEVITDYLTGTTYTVKDGTIDVTLIPGGSIFVTGGKKADYRNEFMQTNLGGNGKVVYNPKTSAYVISGSGSVSNGSDSGLYVTTPKFGAFDMSAKVSFTDDSTAALVVRNGNEDDALTYNVVLKKKNLISSTLTVYARTSKGAKATKIVEEDITGTSPEVRIVRTAANKFKTQYKGVLGGWNDLSNSECSIPMSEKVFAGMVSISGTSEISEISFTNYDANYSATDSANVISADFTLYGNATLASNKITLKGATSVSHLTSKVEVGDWTFKADVLTNPGDSSLAGVAAICDNDEMVFAGRTTIDGQSQIVLARVVNGDLAVYASEDDTDPDASLTVQLQRIGNHFTAVYCYEDSDWVQLDNYIFAGFLAPKVGIVSKGTSTVSYKNVGFGNCDGVTYNTPITLNNKFSTTEGYKDVADALCHWDIVNNNGNSTENWDYKSGGIYNKSATAKEYMYINDSLDDNDYRVETTIRIDSGSGHSGIVFKKPDMNPNLNTGYSVRLTKSGKLTLYNGNTKIGEKNVEIPEMGLRIVVESVGNKVVIYYGTNARLAFCIDTTVTNGYVGFYSEAAATLFANYDLYSLAQSWTITSQYGQRYGGNGDSWKFEKDKITGTSRSSTEFIAAAPKGVANTNVEASINITSSAKDDSETYYAGLLFAATIGSDFDTDGVAVLIEDGKNIVIRKNGEIVARKDGVTLDGSDLLKVKVLNGKYTVYLNGTSVVTYTDTELNGGAVHICGYNAQMEVTNFKVTDITNQ